MTTQSRSILLLGDGKDDLELISALAEHLNLTALERSPASRAEWGARSASLVLPPCAGGAALVQLPASLGSPRQGGLNVSALLVEWRSLAVFSGLGPADPDYLVLSWQGGLLGSETALSQQCLTLPAVELC